MLDYVVESLMRFLHNSPQKIQDQPHPHTKPNYGAKVQYAEEDNSSPLHGKYVKRFIQEVICTFLYYAQSLYCTILAALGSIETQQVNPTKNAIKILSNY